MKPISYVTTWVIKTRKVDNTLTTGITYGKPYKVVEWISNERFLLENDRGMVGFKYHPAYWEDYSYEENLKKILEE